MYRSLLGQYRRLIAVYPHFILPFRWEDLVFMESGGEIGVRRADFIHENTDAVNKLDKPHDVVITAETRREISYKLWVRSYFILSCFRRPLTYADILC